MNRAYERWTCPKCGHGIDLRITPVTPPTCACRPGKQPTTMTLRVEHLSDTLTDDTTVPPHRVNGRGLTPRKAVM